MRKLFIITLSAFAMFMFNDLPGFAKVLKTGILDSTGIVGLDMIIGSEPVPIINQVFRGTPAEKAGLSPGDRILSVDNQPLYGLSSDQVDIAISDIPGTKVHMTILRFGQKVNIELTVAPLHESSKRLQNEFAYR